MGFVKNPLFNVNIYFYKSVIVLSFAVIAILYRIFPVQPLYQLFTERIFFKYCIQFRLFFL